MVGRKKKVEEHCTLNELKEMMKEHKDSYNLYRKLFVVISVIEGETIMEASNKIGVSRKTGERWVNNYNENGLTGLYSNYHKCGKKSKLSKTQLNKLKELINSNDEDCTVENIQILIKNEFGVEYSYNAVWTIVRKKLNIYI